MLIFTKDLGLRQGKADMRQYKIGLYTCSECEEKYEVIGDNQKTISNCKGCRSKKKIGGTVNHKRSTQWI